jgi:hypothetical protein
MAARDVLKLIVDADSSGAVKEFNQLGTAIKDRSGDADQMASGLKGKLGGAMEGLAGKSSFLSGKLDQMGVSGNQAGAALAGALPSAALAGGAALAALSIKAIQSASAYEETASKTASVFGDSTSSVMKWADTAATSFGQSKTEALNAASSFGNMFTQLGIGEETARSMSTSMTELASDFASFHNTSTTDAIDAVSAAFRGEYDSVQRFVPTINAAAVEQKALEMGLAGTTKELTAQDKALASYELIMKGAGDATGDFDRTSDSLANRMRVLQAQVNDMAADFGSVLVPAVAEAAGQLSSFISFIGQVNEKSGGGLGWFVDQVKQTVNPIERLKASWAGIQEGLGNGPDTTALEKVEPAAMSGAWALDAEAAAAAGMTQELNNFGAATATATAANMAYKGSADAAAGGLANEATQHQAVVSALQAEIDAKLAATNATWGVHAAELAYNEAIVRAAQVTAEFGDTSLQATVANDQAAEAAIRMAAAAQEVAKESGAADGGQQAFIDTLRVLASSAAPAVRDQLNGVIMKLEDVGAQHPEPTLAVNDQATGKIQTVQGLLTAYGNSTATATADVNTAAASEKLRVLQRQLSTLQAGAAKPVTAFAGGTNYAPGGMALVGEQGPELINLPKGSKVYTAQETAAMMGAPAPLKVGGSSGGGGTTIINVNVARGAETQAAKEIKKLLAVGARNGVN